MLKLDDIDILVLTKDEETNLPFALRSVVGWASKIFVLDSGSTDRTCELARELGADVRFKVWEGYAAQKNWALDNLPFTAPWILILDADEQVLPDLRAGIDEIRGKGCHNVPHNGFLVNRYFVFMGRRLRHCGYYPSYNVRMFRRGFARYEEREVHEHMIVDGPVGRLPGHLEHNDRRGLEVYIAKHNRYSTLEAHDILRARKSESTDPASLRGPMAAVRWFKARLYPYLPARWVWRFLYMYVIRAGWLDGVAGLRFCLLISSYQLQIDLKVAELSNS